MNPQILMYGGVHNDPGSRRRFVGELAKHKAPPHFVAVEWEESVFQRFVACRPLVKERLQPRWDFLTYQDCVELSLALAWEGDAYKECFPGAEPLWLETGFQEARCDENSPRWAAESLLLQLCNPCSEWMSSFVSNADPLPAPRSKADLVDCVSRYAWREAFSDNNFARDKRWESAICNRISGLQDGWIAIVVGWAHADPGGGTQRLRSLLLSQDFSVTSIRLGP